MDGTPIYDIKPYLPYTDSHPDAVGGFAHSAVESTLRVEFPEQWICLIPEERRQALTGILAHDPRPPYQKDSDRIYGLTFAGFEIRFTVQDRVLRVCEVAPSEIQNRRGR